MVLKSPEIHTGKSDVCDKMLIRHFEPYESILYDLFLGYNNNVQCRECDNYYDFCHLAKRFYLNCNNNSNNITRRKRGRQTTFHKVGGHPCLRLDLSSLDRDEQFLSVSPPPLLRRGPPSLPSLPAPPGADPDQDGGNSRGMGSGASSTKSCAVVSSDTTLTKAVTVSVTETKDHAEQEAPRPLMPSRNETIQSRDTLISGGAVKEETGKQSVNNNAASPKNQKKSKDSNSNNQKHHYTDSNYVTTPSKANKNATNASPECNCTPVTQRKKSTKPPSCDAYTSLEFAFFTEGREVDYVQGDGNCFFRALSKEIYGSEDNHYELRQLIVDLMSRHRSEFEQFTDTSCPQSFASHVLEMRQFAVWATTAEIYAAATLLQRDIYVFSPDHTGTRYSWLLFSPCFPRESEVVSPCPQCYITLCHTNGNHYDRVAPIDGRCNCSQPPPELGGAQLVSAADNSSTSLYVVNADNRSDRTKTPGE